MQVSLVRQPIQIQLLRVGSKCSTPCALRRTSLESILELPGDGFQGPHASSTCGLSPLRFFTPVVYQSIRSTSHNGSQFAEATYTVESWLTGNRTMSMCVFEYVTSGDLNRYQELPRIISGEGIATYHSAYIKCAFCCGACQKTMYPSLL